MTSIFHQMSIVCAAAVLGLGGCASGAVMSSGDGGEPLLDGGAMDSSAVDSSPWDASVPDAGASDATIPDASELDASAPDASAPDASVPDASGPDAMPGPTGAGLMFTEYIEGGAGLGSSKALEIYYGGMGVLNLSLCQVLRYTNGASTPSASVSLAGTLPSAGVFVLCSATWGEAFCDQSSGIITHNGDDAYELVCVGTVVDSFGRVGEDPGVAWSGGSLSTRDTVLRRRCTVTTGDALSGDAFDPSLEWESAGDTDLSGFGRRGC